MRKVVLGVSVYPQHIEFNEIKKYLITAKKYGFTKIFTSLFYLDQPSVNINLPKYLRLFKLAKQLGFYIIADIGPSVIRMLKDDNHFSKLKLFQIDCLRLDTPLLPSVVADATYQGVDIQINASNDTKFIDDVISLKANISRISVLHNFYPKNQTGLGWDYFSRCNKKYQSLKIANGTFVTSQAAYFGQQPITNKQIKLPTLEKHRSLPIQEQAKEIINKTKLNEIFIGNFPASDLELKVMSQFAKPFVKNKYVENVINLKVTLEKNLQMEEKNIANYKYHFRRGDLTDGFIRSTDTRLLFRNVKPQRNISHAKRGDIIVINNSDKHYAGELWIILRNKFIFIDNTFNYIGKVNPKDLQKLSRISSWNHFRLKC